MSYKTDIQDLDYEANNFGKDEYGEVGIKCKNHFLCDAVLPNWWWECKSCYICTNCDMAFGTWSEFKGPGVLETDESGSCIKCKNTNIFTVTIPSCGHDYCLTCLKRSKIVWSRMCPFLWD